MTRKKEKKPEMEKHGAGPRIDASVVNTLLRDMWRKICKLQHPISYSEESIWNYSKKIVSDLTPVQVYAIAQGAAELRGTTPGPITFHMINELPLCPRCKHGLSASVQQPGVLACLGCAYVYEPGK